MYDIRPRPHQKFDAWLEVFTATQCNLSCTYCFARSEASPIWNEFMEDGLEACAKGQQAFTQDSTAVKSSLRKCRGLPIDVDALMRVMEETGKTFHIGFTGSGEPFFAPNFIDACERITQKHFMSVFTNLTSPTVLEFSRRIDPGRVIYMCVSFHIKELERLNLVERWLEHVFMLKEKKFNLYCDQVAHPSLVHEARKYKDFLKKKGIDLRYSSFRGRFMGKEYPKSYTPEDMEEFGLQETDITNYYQKGNICNAGHNVGVVTLTGRIRACYSWLEDIGSLQEGIKFRAGLVNCPQRMCLVPFNKFNPEFLLKSLKDIKEQGQKSCGCEGARKSTC